MKIYVITLCFLISTLKSLAQTEKKNLIEGQSKNFPAYTAIETEKLKKFQRLYTTYNYDPDSLNIFRNFLELYIKDDDAYAMYLYYLSYQYSKGCLSKDCINNDTTTRKALYYLQRASDKNMAAAHLELYQIYHYGWMYVNSSASKAYQFLHKALLHGDTISQVNAYIHLGSFFHPLFKKEHAKKGFKTSIDSCMFYIKKAVSLSPKNHDAISALRDVYIEQKKFDLMFSLLLESKLDYFIVQAAEWLIEGKYGKKDVGKGLVTLYELVDRQLTKFPKYYEGEANNLTADPIWVLHKLYLNKKISKEQVSKYYNKELLKKIEETPENTIEILK